MNILTMTGRLVRDCETRFTKGGMAICTFTVAVDYGYGENKGVNFIRCSLFGKRAEGKLPEYLLKGNQVAVSGELKVREYEDKDSVKRTSVECNVATLDLIGGKSESSAPKQASGFPTHGGNQPARNSDPFANSPDFHDAPIDDYLPF